MVDTARPVRSGALVAVVVTVLASAFVAIRAVGESYAPGPPALGRPLVGASAVGVGMLVSRRWVTPTGREWELPPWPAVVGGAVCLAGVGLSRRR